MRARLLPEPELQFGQGGQHVDPRFGLLEFGPADLTAEAAPTAIPVGVVGTQETIEGALRWLRRLQKPIAARPGSRHPNFHPPFPGADPRQGFPATLSFDGRLQRAISGRDIRALARVTDRERRLNEAVQLLMEEIEAVAEHGLARVVLICPPLDLLEQLKVDGSSTGGAHLGPPELHDVLKAAALRLAVPLQFVLPATYDDTQARKQTTATGRPRTQQDEATKAWNISTALYYKAGGFPWALQRDARALDSCFIGISFYFERDGGLATSTAQVFDERGEGVVVRGGPAKLTKLDRHPYLEADTARELLLNALKRYRSEHKRLPARVVVHKSSRFRGEELEGLQDAADSERVEELELVVLSPSSLRFSPPKEAALRGTQVLLDEVQQALYTSGRVPFYGLYPGPYVPQPLSITLQQSERSPAQHGLEVLALTKLNWNNCRLDGRDPITIRAARTIGTILRHVPPDGIVGGRYAHYM